MDDKSYMTLCTCFASLLLYQDISTIFATGCSTRFSSKWQDLGGDYCYIIESDLKVNWTEAAYHCMREGGYLASFHSTEDAQRVAHHVNEEGKRLYIGLLERDDGSLHWVDGSALDFTNWFPGEPNLVFEKCVEIYLDSGMWNDVDCDEEFGYVCSIWKPASRETQQQSIYSCGSDIYSDYGRLQTPNFPENYGRLEECTWNITVAEGQQVILQFQSFDLEYSEDCMLDFVEVLDGHEPDSAILGSFCGSYNPGTIRSSRNKMSVIFMSDNSRERPGFSANFSKDEICGGDIFAREGTFWSPNYPYNYRSDEKCVWHIKVPENHRVLLRFQKFEVGDTASCSDDFVEVFDGHDAASPVLGKFCGYLIPNFILSSGNEMTVIFSSDASREYTGFHAIFKKYTCGWNMAYDTATFTSSNYPQNYRKNEFCIWKITVKEHHQVILSFDSFDLEGFADDCRNDYVEVRDGHGPYGLLLGRYCGHHLPDKIWSLTNKVTVTFVSNDIIESKGFVISYTEEDVITQT